MTLLATSLVKPVIMVKPVPRGSAIGGDGGDASPPFLRVRGIIPPIFRKIVDQIR